MNRLLVLLTLFFAACSDAGHQHGDDEREKTGKHADAVSIPSNNGQKWKADSSTKLYAASMLQLVNQDSYKNPEKAKQLSDQLQVNVDAMVKACTMKGPAHDALHVWLEKLFQNIKELKETEPGGYAAAYGALQKHLAAFNDHFE